MTDNDYYKLKVRCKNCDHKDEIEIPKGKELENVECKNCGLKNLEKQRPDSFDISPEASV